MRAQLTTTYWKDGERSHHVQPIVFSDLDADRENELVCIYPEEELHPVRGFGCALTEAAGYVLSQMPEDKVEEIIDACYGKDGLGYCFGRIPLDSCDFSLENYSAISEPCTEALEGFSLARDEKYVLPLVKRVQKAAPQSFSAMLSPWSPPAFMKTNGEKNHGGRLKEEYWGIWAKYICRYIREYEQRGVPISMLTPQNEPKAVQTWDSCIFTAEEEKRFIADYLYPEMEKQGLKDHVDLIVWDHNKERVYEWARVLFEGETAAMTDGIAIHWYSGDHFRAVDYVHRRYPDKRIVFTEACIEYRMYAEDDVLRNAMKYAHEIIGSLNGGVDTFFDWNLTLDLQGGPNHAGNFCEAPIMCDPEKGVYKKMPSYDYIGHFTRNFVPGARIIGSSSCSRDLETVACIRPDGKIAVTVLNYSAENKQFHLRLKGLVAPVSLPAKGILTCLAEV